MAGSFAARGVESPSAATYAPTYTQQVTAQFMAPAKKEFSAIAFAKDLAIVSAPRRSRPEFRWRDEEITSRARR